MFSVVPSLKILPNQGFTPWSLEDIYSMQRNLFVACKGTAFQPRLSQIRGNENLLPKSHPSTTKATKLISIYLKHSTSLLVLSLQAHRRMNFGMCFQLDSSSQGHVKGLLSCG